MVLGPDWRQTIHDWILNSPGARCSVRSQSQVEFRSDTAFYDPGELVEWRVRR